MGLRQSKVNINSDLSGKPTCASGSVSWPSTTVGANVGRNWASMSAEHMRRLSQNTSMTFRASGSTSGRVNTSARITYRF